jgi:endo-1,4-beta-mannosidase
MRKTPLYGRWRPGRSWRLFIAVLLLIPLVATACGGGGSGRPSIPPGFVTAAGGRLWLAGKQFRFAGINVWNADTPAGNPLYGCGQPANLDAIAPEFGPGIQVVRVWFFQRLATTPDGRRDWSAFDRTLSAASRHHLKVVVALGNEWYNCEGYTNAKAGYKDEEWYRQGYRTKRPLGQSESYRDWVQEVVARYRDNPTIMMWQLMNEAEDALWYEGPCGPEASTVLRSFTSDVSRLVKRTDPWHLVSLGTVGSGQCGAAAGEYRSLYAIPTVDVADYHDYSLATLSSDGSNGLAERLSQMAAIGKPLVVSELGVLPSAAGGLSQRAALIRKKIDAQRAAGADGVLLWSWPGAPVDGYQIGPGDPALTQLDGLARAG